MPLPQLDAPGAEGVELSTLLTRNCRRALSQLFTPADLRHLAAMAEHNRAGMMARRRLSPEEIEEYAEMVASGRTPTIGWWRRHGGR